MRFLDRVPFTALGLLWPFGNPPQAPGPPVGPLHTRRSFRLVAANALKSNRRPGEWADAVLSLDADVLCVVELTPAINAALRIAPGDRLPPHSFVDVRAGSAGTGVWSRLPLDGARSVDAGYVLVAASVPTLGLSVAAVHTIAPATWGKGPLWWSSFDAVHRLVDETGDQPLVVAGDWNATMGHGPLRRLVAGGVLRDAHVDAGRRFARTWPAHMPVALLDRVLVSRHVAVHAITEHRLPGSDHRAVAADLTVVDRELPDVEAPAVAQQPLVPRRPRRTQR